MIKKRLIALIFSFFFIFSIFIPFIPISPLINNISQEGVTQDKNEPIEKIIDTDLDLATKNSSIISQGSAIGTGNPQTVTLTCEKNQTLTNYNSTNDFNITTSGWNMTQAYLNFTEIFAPNYTYTIEDYSNNTVSLSSEYAGSFKIDQDTTLTQISVYFSCSAIQPRFYYSIYNATWDGFKPKPHVAIFSSIGLTTQSIAASWKKYNSSVDLMTDETDNNTYFVSAYTSVIQIYWSFQRDLDDGSDDSYAYIHDFSPDWTLYQDPVSPFSLIDFNFKVDLTNYTVKPSQVNMQVNGTNVSDIDFGEGTVLLNQTEISQGNFDQIRFDIQSDSFINYSVNCSGNFQNQTSINSVYEVLTAENTDWNVSFTADFLANANNQKINSTIGSDWENATIYNNSVIYDNVIIDESDDLVFIDNVTTNGSWVLSCSQENYGNTIQLYQYGSLNNITLNRLVNMSDTIYINATLSGATGGEANLTIFDPIGTNVVNKSNNDTISGTLITFTDVILPNIATTNGTYIIQILWWNGSAVSLMQTDLEIINRTQLNLLSEAQITGQHYIGDYINISVYLNDTSKGSGSPCGDADLSIEVFNLTDESIVETISSGSISEGILGSGYYNYTLNTINYINGSFKIRVNSTKLGAVNHTLNTSSFSLIFDTNLTLVNFAGTNLGTTYYNNSIFLKFAYDFNNSRYSYNQNVSIGVAFDDATYDNGGTWLPSFNDITTSDPMIGEITRAYMRFHINLSRGATVTKANLYLNITSTTDPDIRIVLIDDECLSFPFGSGDETSYPESSFYVDFNASQSVGWNVVDISSLIQAFVNRDDYHPGQYMGLKFKETFITPDSGDQITLAAFESGTEYCSYIDLEANGGEDIVQDPSIITIQIDEESPVILHLNDTTKTYDIQLNSTDHPFITHTLQVVAQKMGYKNYSKPYTWTTIGANGRIENFLVDQQTVINNTGIVNTNFPNNITVSFQYLNDTSIDGAIANVSINGSYLKAINYYPSTETYNFTVNFEEIGYNPTYPEVLPKEISVEISKYGYDPLFYNFTWNYSRAETDLTYNGTIAALYTYPTNLTLTLNYSVSSLYSNEEVENGNVKVYVNETDHIVTWDPISELYNVTFNNTNFYNRTEIWNITITASRNGFENRSLQFWWNTSEILTDLTLDNIAGTDLGTTYYNKSIYLKFSYNMTSPNIWVQNPEVITIQVDGNIPINLNTNGSFNCYDISLDSMDYPFGLHTIQVIAQKYGYQNRTQNYTWKTENATARIENFLVNGLSVTNETGIVNTNYPNNLTISFVYSNDTAIHGATANISVNGIYLKDISYYGASQTYNFTLDFTEINYNPTYPDNIAPIIMVNISKYGYTAAWYYFTWNYSRAETDLTYNGT
ncbi:MAG: hypothetical protein EAX96_02315, partial [Candidatus Lokiarchaeota archaeon]|nr:hypothetical protein [Candidatus Lokiarchaeota archaeon]